MKIFFISRYVVLPTAQIRVVNCWGYEVRARALLDQGSEVSFVSESLVQRIGLQRRRVYVSISGIGAKEISTAKSAVTVHFGALNNSFASELEALVLARPAARLPSKTLPDSLVDKFKVINWADPRFHKPGEIDLVLGVEVYAKVLREGLNLSGSQEGFIAQNTDLGWIISGASKEKVARRADSTPKLPRVTAHGTFTDELCELIRRFWETEEIPSKPRFYSPDDEYCEKHYVETHRRSSSGRYVVRIPLKTEPAPGVGLSLESATSSFNSLRRRLLGDQKLKDEYSHFMQEYESLGHMELVPEKDLNKERVWYLPHHAVVQNRLGKRKIRVVFDASRRTALGNSLNNLLLSGPPLQRELSHVLMDWRQHRYVFTTDMVKMFRQILVDPADRDLQRIVWTSSRDQSPKVYRLTTVTYGTSSAPFLAIRTLKQIVLDEGHRFPLAARCIEEQTYVDDVFSGANDVTKAREIADQLVKLLKTAGIDLDKWAANDASLIPRDVGRPNLFGVEKTIRENDTVKALGLLWQPNEDIFRFNVQFSTETREKLTKREILSEIARLFDPLGWLSPIVVTAKILLQDLWIIKTGWDELLSSDLVKRWNLYKKNLEGIRDLSIPRWLGPVCITKCELHGFADASKRAFAAAVYLCSVDENGNIKATLLTAKSKVAPIKTLSIPNLELCGGVLLVKLLKHVRMIASYKELPITAWLDSRDALAWIRNHPSRWKTFVANRVSYVQTELPNAVWKYVRSEENPADLATRGVSSEILNNYGIWWCGPEWLQTPEESWPEQPIMAGESVVRSFNTTTTTIRTEEDGLLGRFSSLNKLIKVIAYCLRFRENCERSKVGLTRDVSFLTAVELERARRTAIKIAQSSAFASELSQLRRSGHLSGKGPLNGLNPFIDKHGIMRVGGRLHHSKLSFTRKHPPILSRGSKLSAMFIEEAHRLALHGGPTLTLSTLLQSVWIIGAPRLVKIFVRNCMRCARTKPRKITQMMGDLPEARVTPTRAFAVSGVDYAGPFTLRSELGRGKARYKGYIALFVCFSTKAVHLEAVKDMSTVAFLSALRRFISRRGKCIKIYSDNGSNFIGADRELRAMFHASSEFYGELAASLALRRISWSFIPPGSPHFGGLWEAGVKSVKHHLSRTIGDSILTYEELATVLAEIEACLNSRPLCPLTNDTDDLHALTPSHLIMGESPTLIPDAPPPEGPENRLMRHQLLSRMRQNFWKRWSEEYLHHLQQRNKWRTPTRNFTIGQLVAVKDDRYPPAKWPLGRIIEVHKGEDGLVRVVTIKTATKILKRPIVRLSPLPPDDDLEQ